MLVLDFKQYKSNAGIYHYLSKKTKKLVIAIVYVNDIYFMSSKDYLLLVKINIVTNLTSTLILLNYMFESNNKQYDSSFYQKY